MKGIKGPIIKKSNGLSIVVTTCGVDGALSGRVYDRENKLVTTKRLSKAEQAVFEKGQEEGKAEVSMSVNPRLINTGDLVSRSAPSSVSGRGGDTRFYLAGAPSVDGYMKATSSWHGSRGIWS